MRYNKKKGTISGKFLSAGCAFAVVSHTIKPPAKPVVMIRISYFSESSSKKSSDELFMCFIIVV